MKSYILILVNKSTKKFFGITGDFGHMDILEIATNDLGIEILSRIVKKEDKVSPTTKEPSLTGGVQVAIKFSRITTN